MQIAHVAADAVLAAVVAVVVAVAAAAVVAVAGAAVVAVAAAAVEADVAVVVVVVAVVAVVVVDSSHGWGRILRKMKDGVTVIVTLFVTVDDFDSHLLHLLLHLYHIAYAICFENLVKEKEKSFVS